MVDTYSTWTQLACGSQRYVLRGKVCQVICQKWGEVRRVFVNAIYQSVGAIGLFAAPHAKLVLRSVEACLGIFICNLWNETGGSLILVLNKCRYLWNETLGCTGACALAHLDIPCLCGVTRPAEVDLMTIPVAFVTLRTVILRFLTLNNSKLSHPNIKQYKGILMLNSV